MAFLEFATMTRQLNQVLNLSDGMIDREPIKEAR